MDTQTEFHVEREAETGGMCLQARECGGLLAPAQIRQREMQWTLLGSLQKEPALLTPSFQASSLWNHERINLHPVVIIPYVCPCKIARCRSGYVEGQSLNSNPSIIQYCLWLTFFFFLILWTRYLLGSNCLTCKMRKWSRTRWFSKNFLQPLVIHDLRESFHYFCIAILSLGLPVTFYS